MYHAITYFTTCWINSFVGIVLKRKLTTFLSISAYLQKTSFYSKYIWDFVWHFTIKAVVCHTLKYCCCVIFQSSIYIFINFFALNLLTRLVPWRSFACFSNKTEVIISISKNCAKCNWRALYCFNHVLHHVLVMC